LFDFAALRAVFIALGRCGCAQEVKDPDRIEIAALKETVVVNENGDRKTITKFRGFRQTAYSAEACP